jgi:mono/diheme cytochrome c family protein
MKRLGLSLFCFSLGFLLWACAPSEPAVSALDLPVGDAARGASLFSQSIMGNVACSACHTVDGREGSGPTLQGFGAVAGERIKGQSAEEYTYLSIVRPSAHVLRGYPNVMPVNYERTLTTQQIADLMAYILGL